MQLSVYAESQYELSVLSSSMQFSTSPLSYPLADSELVNTTPVDHSTPHRHSKRKPSCLLPPSSSVASLTLKSTQTSRTFIDFLSTSCCKKEMSEESLCGRSWTLSREIQFKNHNRTESVSAWFFSANKRNEHHIYERSCEGKVLCCDAFTSVLEVSETVQTPLQSVQGRCCQISAETHTSHCSNKS